MIRFFTTSVCLIAGVTLQLPVPIYAATVTISKLDNRKGAPIAQSFIDTRADNISIVVTPHGASCVASRKLQISESSYKDSAGEDILFADITRSPASSIQAIARPQDLIAFRVQLKYAPDRDEPIEIAIGDRIVDLADALEPSGDSLFLKGDTARILSEALRGDVVPVLHATSKDTGHLVADRIAAPDMTGLEACLETLHQMQVQNRPDKTAAGDDAVAPNRPDTESSAKITLIDDQAQNSTRAATGPSMSEQSGEAEDDRSLPALPTPVTGIRVDFIARPDPEARISPDELAHCRMRDIPETVFLGRLTGVTGFFSQTQDIYVAFDDQGKVQRAYIPGIFDSDLTTVQGRAHVSLAADSNVPDQPNAVSGCLGDALLEAPVCVISEENDRYSVAECGVLGMSETRDGFLVPDPVQELMTVTGSNNNSVIAAILDTAGIIKTSEGLKKRNVASVLPGPKGGGPDLPVFEDDTPVPNEDDDPLTPVPLPAAFWMMMGSLAGLFLLRSQGQKNICRRAG